MTLMIPFRVSTFTRRDFYFVDFFFLFRFRWQSLLSLLVMSEDAVPPDVSGFLSGHETNFCFTEDDAYPSETEVIVTSSGW